MFMRWTFEVFCFACLALKNGCYLQNRPDKPKGESFFYTQVAMIVHALAEEEEMI
jgi:hypothetical protein